MDWTRGQTIGRGSTATVSIATYDRSREVFAVKSAEVSNSKFLQREQRILSTLMCPQIVAYKGCNISSENGKVLFNLFLEYEPGGTVSDAIRGHGGGLDEPRIRSYTRSILHGLQYLHSNGIVHCDIKSQNVLVTSDGAKIADLGCARRVGEVSRADWGSAMPIGGTPMYMAPEVARGEEQDFPADVWALGCTIIEMATGLPPWVNVSDPVSVLYRIGFSTDVPEIPKFMSKQAKDFLGKCLKRDPEERLSASELLKHEFVNEPCSVFTETKNYNLETPTSVMAQGFWYSMEVLETKSRSSSPKERIRELSEGNSSSLSEMLNWAWDETWVTVRSNGSKELEDLLLCDKVVTNNSRGETEEYCNLDIHIPDEPIRSMHEKGSHIPCNLCKNDMLWRTQTSMNEALIFSIIYLSYISNET